MDIKGLFHLDDEIIDHLEFYLAISERFPWHTRTGNKTSVIFKSHDDDFEVKIDFSKRRRISLIEAQGTNCRSRSQKLSEEVRHSVFGDFGTRVITRVVFANKPVRGIFRWKDQLQMIPPAPEMPQQQIDPKLGGHPFRIEAKYSYSNSWLINKYRSLQSMRIGFLSSATMLDNSIRSPEDWFHFDWTLGDNGVPDFRNISYPIYEHPLYHEFPMFTHTSDKALTSASKIDRFNSFDENPEFEISFDLSNGLQKIEGLEPYALSKFLNAAFWLDAAIHSVNQNNSARYLLLISAIEALLPEPSDTFRCDTCGTEQGRHVVSRFVSFMERFSSLSAKEARQMYDLRSEITHGSHLFLEDLFLTELPGSTHNGFERLMNDPHTVAGAVKNWLMST